MPEKNADRYYDSLLEREKRNSWWRVSLRYFFSVSLFLLLVWSTLFGYWTWEDYFNHGSVALSWENMLKRAEFRLGEIQAGRFGL